MTTAKDKKKTGQEDLTNRVNAKLGKLVQQAMKKSDAQIATIRDDNSVEELIAESNRKAQESVQGIPGPDATAVKTQAKEIHQEIHKETPSDATARAGAYTIPVHLIDPNPYQPRKKFDSENINELAKSIQTVGQMSPIVVRRARDRYQLIAGERRWRAMQSLEREYIDAELKDVTDEVMALMALIENVQREDLSDYEIGCSIYNIQHQFSTKTELAEYLGKSRMDVYRYAAFLELPDWIISRLEDNPRLFNRKNALALKTKITSEGYSEVIYRRPIIEAMNLLEARENTLAQVDFVPYIEKLVKKALNREQSITEPVKKNFSVDGKNIGKLHYDDRKGLSISIKPSAITSADVDAIHEFIAARMSGK
ncbi:ParB/RepB/Spo0J family partition protein [Methylobacter sp.]|uniref:ParB/RepB/Spo0J family partition protein n=1 Tax=Methylobacter sp. TaxID=2051955 RepID=UPI003DA34A0E